MVGANFALKYTCNTCTLLFFSLQLSKIRAAALGFQLLLLWPFTIVAFHVLNSCVFLFFSFFFLRITTVNFSLWHVYMMLPLRFLHTIFLYIISNKFIKIWCCIFYETKTNPKSARQWLTSRFCIPVFPRTVQGMFWYFAVRKLLKNLKYRILNSVVRVFYYSKESVEININNFQAKSSALENHLRYKVFSLC